MYRHGTYLAWHSLVSHELLQNNWDMPHNWWIKRKLLCGPYWGCAARIFSANFGHFDLIPPFFFEANDKIWVQFDQFHAKSLERCSIWWHFLLSRVRFWPSVSIGAAPWLRKPRTHTPVNFFWSNPPPPSHGLQILVIECFTFKGKFIFHRGPGLAGSLHSQSVCSGLDINPDLYLVEWAKAVCRLIKCMISRLLVGVPQLNTEFSTNVKNSNFHEETLLIWSSCWTHVWSHCEAIEVPLAVGYAGKHTQHIPYDICTWLTVFLIRYQAILSIFFFRFTLLSPGQSFDPSAQCLVS